MDIIIRKARIWGRDGLFDIGIEHGKIIEISEKIAGSADKEINADGRLVTPSFIDPHLHLDKVYTYHMAPNPDGTLYGAIYSLWQVKKKYTIEDIKKRASRVIRSALVYGTTHIRTHVDVDTIGGLTPLKALLEIKKEFKDVVDIQVVAFPQEGILRDPGSEELMWKAMELGADVVGGMPHSEWTDDDMKRHVDIIFEIAKEYGKPIDAHVDETDDPYSRSIEYFALKTFREGLSGKVTADHVCALSAYNDYHAAKVIDLLKQANVNIITNPETNIVIEGRLDTYPKRRGLTRVKELWKAGVNVSFGQDCVQDAFYPYGKADRLLTAWALALMVQMTTPEEIEAVMNMATYNAAKIFGIENNYGVDVGKNADLVIIDTDNVLDAIRLQPARLWVIRNGDIVAQSKYTHDLYL
jgi:cytosine deaminase